MLPVAANLVMVKQLELDLKFESKYLFFIVFQQSEPTSQKSFMSRGLVKYIVVR
jgi:hypothetical protein